jgi:pimeloyl-ACP methyl ester carboxylesterase
MSERYRTIAVDLRGHGRTDNPSSSGKPGSAEMHIGQMADDLTGLLDALGYESSPVVGYSLGGCVALLAGLKQPGRIQSLVMHATKFFWDEKSINTMLANLDPEAAMKRSPRYTESLRKNHAAVYGDDYWQTLLRTASAFIKTMPEEAPNIKQAAAAAFPVLVSVGDHDQLIPIEEAAALYRALPKGELMVLPATRHPFQTVRLDSFVPAVYDFLGRALTSSRQ